MRTEEAPHVDDRDPAPAAPCGPPGWTTLSEAVRVVGYPTHLRRTLATAAIVGTLLFAINQLDVALQEGMTPSVVTKGLLNYLVPFCVANVGVLSACRHRRSPEAAHDEPEER